MALRSLAMKALKPRLPTPAICTPDRVIKVSRTLHAKAQFEGREVSKAEAQDQDKVAGTLQLEKSEVLSNGITFSPFREAAGEVTQLNQLMSAQQVGTSSGVSYGRVLFSDRVEAAINEQINIELSMSYVYHAMYNYFNRDNVGLKGFAGFFRAESLDERSHAEILMAYQSRRGGRVKLGALQSPESEYFHPEKGDALYAAELALSLEKLNFQKLTELHHIADDMKDSETAHFIEDYLLDPQARDVEESANFVSQLQRIGKGHGVWHFDQRLAEKYPKVAADTEMALP